MTAITSEEVVARFQMILCFIVTAIPLVLERKVFHLFMFIFPYNSAAFLPFCVGFNQIQKPK